MVFSVETRDVELYQSASPGFKGFFDESGEIPYIDKKYKEVEAYDWSMSWLNKIHKSETLDEFIKGIPKKVPYSIEIKESELLFTFSCPNGLIGKYIFDVNISYANIVVKY